MTTTTRQPDPSRPASADTTAALAAERAQSGMERERLALILDGMSEAVLVVDADGAVVATNREYDAQFGPRELVPVPQDAAGRDLPRAQWPQTLAARGRSFSMSFTRFDPATGTRRSYEANGRGAREGTGGIVVFRDLTDRSVRRLQERFIDTAGHELQTPLAALHNYLQLIERGVAAGDDPAVRRFVGRAIEQSRLLGDLASELFDASLIRHGRIVARRDRVDLRAVVRTAVEDVLAATPDAEIELQPAGGRAMVLGDPIRLRQLCLNVLRNAVTHGAAETPVEVSVTSDGATVTVWIRDHGPGLPEPVASELVAPADPTDLVTPGLGLGLFLAHAIAIEHEGSLTLVDAPGAGTEARLELPVAPRARRASR